MREPPSVRISAWKLAALLLGAGALGGFFGQLSFVGLVVLLFQLGKLLD